MKDFIRSVINIPNSANHMGLPILIEGPPGGGKTAMITQVAKEEGLPIETVILSVREPADVVGLPVLKDGAVHIETPLWCKNLVQAGKGILFFDELACAPQSVQAAALRIIQDRAVGDIVLPPEVRIIAATNNTEQAAGGWDIAAPLANRFLHYKWNGPTVQAWTRWFLSNKETYVRDKSWDSHFASAKGMVCAFMNSKPGLLGPNVPEDPEQASRAWPSPRTWEMATRAFALCKKTDQDYTQFISGLVGEGCCVEFTTFDFYKDLPSPADLLDGKIKFKPTDRLDQTYSVLYSLASYAISYPDLAPRAWSVIGDIGNQTFGKDVIVQAAQVLIEEKLYRSDEAMRVLEDLTPVLDGIGLKW